MKCYQAFTNPLNTFSFELRLAFLIFIVMMGICFTFNDAIAQVNRLSKTVERSFDRAKTKNDIQEWDKFLKKYGGFAKRSSKIRSFVNQARWAVEKLIFDSGRSEGCAICHEQIYSEWKASYHAKAWQDPLYRAATQNYQKRECFPCHAPEPIFETGLRQEPKARERNREEGVNCFSCHVLRTGLSNGVVGPYKDSQTLVHANLFDKQFKASEMCGVCHRTTYREWEKIDREGEVVMTRNKDEYTCQTCHMSKVNSARPVATNGPLRRRTLAHDFKGSHNRGQLREAFKNFLVRVRDGKLILRIVNFATAHNIPTGMSGRKFIFQAQIITASGEPLPSRKGLITEVFEAVYKTPYVSKLVTNEEPNNLEGSAIGTSEIFEKQYPLPIRTGKVVYTVTYIAGRGAESEHIIEGKLLF